MSTGKNSEKNWFDRLQNRYRLVVMEEDTLELKSSVKLSLLNVYLAGSVVFVVLTGLIVCLLYFTPLKNYLVGYNQVRATRLALAQDRALDSLVAVSGEHEVWIENIIARLNGEVDIVKLTEPGATPAYSDIDLNEVSPEDLKLREEVAREDYFSLLAENAGVDNIKTGFFSVPLEGVITSAFDPSEEHYGVDIVGPIEAPVRAIRDGTVMDTYWDSETGNVIVLQHENNLVSLYKHNSSVLKKVGNFVKAGDAIAIIGNTGALSSGPHLHFEMWYERAPLNPEDYIIFN
ncbi:MAG: murein DD-endopeptidase MepM/ murein hydrolase activator NlpD [Limisphaerales bacterium]|jgi:murein DD-endopeptidase MepM/ murein hydrolase activator NlpD